MLNALAFAPLSEWSPKHRPEVVVLRGLEDCLMKGWRGPGEYMGVLGP